MSQQISELNDLRTKDKQMKQLTGKPSNQLQNELRNEAIF
jgi:hypothetical protein